MIISYADTLSSLLRGSRKNCKSLIDFIATNKETFDAIGAFFSDKKLSELRPKDEAEGNPLAPLNQYITSSPLRDIFPREPATPNKTEKLQGLFKTLGPQKLQFYLENLKIVCQLHLEPENTARRTTVEERKNNVLKILQNNQWHGEKYFSFADTVSAALRNSIANPTEVINNKKIPGLNQKAEVGLK